MHCTWKDLGFVVDIHTLAGVAEYCPPDVGLVNSRQGVVKVSVDKLHGHAITKQSCDISLYLCKGWSALIFSACYFIPWLRGDESLQLGLELLHVKERAHADIKPTGCLHRDHVELDPTLQESRKQMIVV